MSKTNLQQQITIQALPSKVWRVLTNPDYVNLYFFQGNISSDWTEGSSIFLKKEERADPIQAGQVLESVPGIQLKFNLQDEATPSDIILTYELMVDGDGVELKMKCEGFIATDQEYLLRVQQAKIILQKIKWLSEYS